MVSSNFNAPLRMRYGGIRDLVLAASVILPDGRMIRAGRPVVKNVAGYDLPKLFVGAMGSLGLLTDVSLKLAPLPRARESLIVPFDSLADALIAGQRLLRVCLVASALLLCKGGEVAGVSAPYVLIYTAEGLAQDVTAELGQAQAALGEPFARSVVRAEGLAGSETWAHWLASGRGAPFVRAGVAPKDLPEFVARSAPTLNGSSFMADLASGLLYVNGAPLAPVREAALSRGGYAVSSAGSTDERWGYQPEGLPWMRALKARWDPGSHFNPGAFIV